jgi:sigma-E factor negative regulatory protein RseC
MKQTGRITRLFEDGTCEVAVLRESACGGNCASCDGCAETSRMAVSRAHNPLGGGVDDVVEVESSNKVILGIAAVVYLLPVAGLLLGYGIFSYSFANQYLALLGAFIGLALGLLGTTLLDRKKRGKVMLTVTRVIRRT